MSPFSFAVESFWGAADAGFRVVIDPDLAHDRRVSLLRRADGSVVAKVSPIVASVIGRPESEPEFRNALATAGIGLHEADNLYYFPSSAELESSGARRLTSADAAAFALFEASADEQDLDDAYVELDHWAVFGSFEGALLVSAASAYPWGNSPLADIGVLTLPDFRGQGRARTAVRALGAHIRGEGYEPQYRCQLGNAGSIAVAASAGLELFGTWEVVSPDP
jgi:RimJ/RimL family protein N-acetyltransferase